MNSLDYQTEVPVEKKDDMDKKYNVEVAPVHNDYHHEQGAVVKEHDAVFGDITDKGPNYRNVGWIGSTILMCKAMVGLGVLGIPFVFQTVGIVPGIILIIVIQIMVTWSDYIVGQFKINHPEVYGLADAGRVMFGRVGEEVLAVVFCVYMIFVCGSGIVSIATALNAVSVHGACTAVFVIVSALLGFLLASIRTLGQITWLGWVGMVSILGAILTLTISVTLTDRPSDVPVGFDWPAGKDVFIIAHPTFAGGISAVASVVFATSATPTFFGIVSEMRDPRQYTKAMLITQIFVTILYIVIGSIVYVFCGQFVAYPALGSAGPLLKKICYGLAIPGLAVTLTIYSHLPAKYIFVRLMKGSKHMVSNSFQHWATWLSCTFGVIMVAYLIASAIPIFGNLVSFIGAFFCPMICMIPYGMMWWHDNWRGRTADQKRGLWKKANAAMAVFVVVAGTFLTVAGTYGAIVAMVNDKSAGTKPWSCADNSNSVPSA